MTTLPIDHLIGLLNLALTRGEYLRFPHRYSNIKPNICDGVGYHCEQLDHMQIPMWKQNLALAYINDVDRQPVWESMFKRSLRSIAQEILDKTL